MAAKHKKSDVTKSQTRESNTKEPSKAKASLLEATAMGIASGLPFELVEPINLDENEGPGLTMIVF